MPDKANSLTIGGLAKAANVHVETIRYYQRRRLVPEPERPPVLRALRSEISDDRVKRKKNKEGEPGPWSP